MVIKRFFKFTLFFLFVVFLSSCDKEVTIENQEELITTVIFTLRPPLISQPTVVCSYKDLDGDGGSPPVLNISGPVLANTTYNGTIKLLNESVSPTDDITEEVQMEATAHQFFYQTSSNISITYNDTDENGKPLGVNTIVSTSNQQVNNQSIKIILRHEPDKNGIGVSNGDLTKAGGETDIEVEFIINIQ